MIKHTQTICQQQPINCWDLYDSFVGLGLKGLKKRNYLIHTLTSTDCKQEYTSNECYTHIETSKLICGANSLTGFYMSVTLAPFIFLFTVNI